MQISQEPCLGIEVTGLGDTGRHQLVASGGACFPSPHCHVVCYPNATEASDPESAAYNAEESLAESVASRALTTQPDPKCLKRRSEGLLRLVSRFSSLRPGRRNMTTSKSCCRVFVVTALWLEGVRRRAERSKQFTAEMRVRVFRGVGIGACSVFLLGHRRWITLFSTMFAWGNYECLRLFLLSCSLHIRLSLSENRIHELLPQLRCAF